MESRDDALTEPRVDSSPRSAPRTVPPRLDVASRGASSEAALSSGAASKVVPVHSFFRGMRAAFVFLTRVPVGGFPYSRKDWHWSTTYGSNVSHTSPWSRWHHGPCADLRPSRTRYAIRCARRARDRRHQLAPLTTTPASSDSPAASSPLARLRVHRRRPALGAHANRAAWGASRPAVDCVAERA